MTEQLITTLAVTIVTALLASNGLILYKIKRNDDRKDKTAKLCEVNNRQGEELTILSDMMEATIKLTRSLVQALHEKNVFNGNTKEFNRELDLMQDRLQSYTKSKKDKGLFV